MTTLGRSYYSRNMVKKLSSIYKTISWPISRRPSNYFTNKCFNFYLRFNFFQTIVAAVAKHLFSKALFVVKLIISKALSVVKFVISKVIWITVGAGLVIGFCAITPFCTLTIQKPFTRELRSLRENMPYLDEIESYFYQAYDKVHQMYGQNWFVHRLCNLFEK